MNNIIERTLGYSDYAMWKYCESLKRIVLSTIDVKVGRGKAVEVVKVRKYNDSQEVVDRVVNSCEHYKNLHEMNAKIEFRDYQKDIIERGTEIIVRHGFLYLAMEVRTGKTLTSLGIADNVDAEKVLFITKKKAISSIEEDYNTLKPSYYMCIINYESLHTVMDDWMWDLIIIDEAHSCFLGDTLIDGKKIKDISLGDFINSFNFDTNEYELKKVTNLYKNKLNERLIKIKCNGKEIVCTENHKIFTKRGWVRAIDITTEDELQVLWQ